MSALFISAMFWATFLPVSRSLWRQRRSEPSAPACSTVLTRAELHNPGNAPGVARKEEKFLWWPSWESYVTCAGMWQVTVRLEQGCIAQSTACFGERRRRTGETSDERPATCGPQRFSRCWPVLSACLLGGRNAAQPEFPTDMVSVAPGEVPPLTTSLGFVLCEERDLSMGVEFKPVLFPPAPDKCRCEQLCLVRFKAKLCCNRPRANDYK